MAYEKQIWEDDLDSYTPLTEERLNKLDVGTVDLHDEVSELYEIFVYMSMDSRGQLLYSETPYEEEDDEYYDDDEY